ncbi:hypothetical protein BDN71DRAFT_1435920 [Pleurotus eryngii]|uniref:Uncharacterized protein n=1 Tax=Pleurotus eryngii TaxID=5323 RepID=A0A9P6DAK0_PLEER|nr:hypothetical protein BDN71DRAFT_1435920 [Pleurotus eryngii]
MALSTLPAASQPNTQPCDIKPHPTSPVQSPLDKALAVFNTNRPPNSNANENCTGFAKRWAQVASPSYRPSFSYLGEASPDFYGNPVAVQSLRFVGAPSPWEVEGMEGGIRGEGEDSGAAVEKKEIGGSMAAKVAEEKRKRKSTNAKSKSKAKSDKRKAAEVTEKTTTSTGPKASARPGGRQTRSMTKGKVAANTGSLSTSRKITSEPDNLDPQLKKRARLSVPQDAVAREGPKYELEEQEEAKTEKLVIRLLPLSIVRARSSATVVDENEVNTAEAPADEETANEDDTAPGPLEMTTRENVDEGQTSEHIIEKIGTEYCSSSTIIRTSNSIIRHFNLRLAGSRPQEGLSKVVKA